MAATAGRAARIGEPEGVVGSMQSRNDRVGMQRTARSLAVINVDFPCHPIPDFDADIPPDDVDVDM